MMDKESRERANGGDGGSLILLDVQGCYTNKG